MLFIADITLKFLVYGPRGLARLSGSLYEFGRQPDHVLNDDSVTGGNHYYGAELV